MVDINAIGRAFTQPQPLFDAGQLWQYDARDTYRVVGKYDNGQGAFLKLVALGGKPQETGPVRTLDRRTCLIWSSWGKVDQVQLIGGKVLR